MTVQHRVNDRQTSTVVAVGVGTQLMLDHVTLEVGDLADFQDAVFGHSRSPCQLAAGLIVVLVGQQDADAADDAAHDGFVDVIGEVVLVRLAEVSFHRVAQGVERTGNDLLHGNGQRVGGVEESKVGLCTPQGPLNLLFLMGDDRAVVHLGAGTEHRDDGAQRDEFSGTSMLGVFQLPQIFVHLGLCGHHLAAVGHGTAAHGKDQIHMVLTGQLCTLLHLGVGGIGHDAGKLHDALTLGVQNTDDFIIDTIVLDRTAAVGQHHGIAVVLQQTAQIFLHATLAEINLGLVFKQKIVHSRYTPLYKTGKSDVFAHLVGFLHGRGGHHLAGPIYAGAVDDPLFLGTIQAGGKASETLQGAGHGSTVIVRAGHDEIELLVRNVRPPGKAAVDDDLHLCINGVEVHWACHHDNICRLHCVQNFAHVIVQGTLAAVVAAVIAGIAGHNLLAAHEDLLHFVAALLRTTHKLTAQQVGVAVLAGTAGQNQDFLHWSFLL